MPNRASILRVIPSGVAGKVKGIKAGPHGPGSPLFEAVALNSISDFERFREDFLVADSADVVGATKVLNYAESNVNAFITKLTPTATRTSAVRLSTSATNNVNVELVATSAMLLAEQHCWVEICFAPSRVTDLEITVGLVSSVLASAGDILADIDVPSLAGGIADAAVIGLDTAETLQVAALVTRDGVTTRKVNLTSNGLGAANEFVIWRVELRNGKAYAFVNGGKVAESVDNAVRTGQLLSPVFLFGTRAASDLQIDVDYIEFGQERVANTIA
jgi:hypothetical protein